MSQHATPEREQANVNRAPMVLAAVAVVIAVAAAAIAVVALVRAQSDGAPSYSKEQTTTDTRSVCDAFTVNLRAVSLQTGTTAPSGASGASAAAANARLALFAASVNLTDALESAPAAPENVRTAVTDLAEQYRTVATQYLAGASTESAAVTAAVRSAGTAATAVTTACK